MSEPRPGAPPPAWMRRLLARCLPDDDWIGEYVAELDTEHRRRAAHSGRLAAALWYARQCLSPETVRLVRLVRRRRRARPEGMHTLGGGTMRGVEGWASDLRHAARMLWREPRFTLFVGLALGLGIGANAAMFGVAERVLFRGPEQVARPEELARLYLRIPGGGTLAPRTAPWIPWATADAIREEASAARRVAIQRTDELLVDAGGGARPLTVASVDHGYFDLLGTTPEIGRFFGEGELDDGDVAVVSEALWRSAYGGRLDAIGKTVGVGLRSYVVVGVAPAGFTGVRLSPIGVWVPIDEDRAGNRNWQVLVRLPAGPDVQGRLALAAADADAIHHRTDPGRSFRWALDGTVVAAPIAYDDEAHAPVEASVARLFLAVAALMLLIACANVASLMLARLTRRRRELSVRLALGAGRLRLTRLLLTETLVLATAAGGLSLPVAWATTRLCRSVLLPGLAWPSSALSWPVLVTTALAALGAGTLVALLPLRQVGRADVVQGLSTARGTGGRRRPRVHLALATLQVALSTTLLLGAGLFVKSFLALRVTDLGVDAREVDAVTLRSMDARALPSPSDEELAVYRRALDALSGDPDVRAAALSVGLPFLYNFGMSIAVPGRDSIPELPGGGPYFSAVTAGYFEAIGTTVVEGRSFTAREVADGAPVVVVSASMARTLWPGGGALGQCVRMGTATSPCAVVIGVVEDVHRVGYREPPSMQYYVPLTSGGGFGGMALVLRPSSGGEGVVSRIRARLRTIDPAIDYVDVTRLDTLLDGEVRPWRTGSWVLGMAAMVALAVSLAGVYAVLSYLVEQRRREIGVRIALGASSTGIRGLVVRGGLTAVGLGLALGLMAAAATAPWVRPLLFETRVLDPVVLVGTASLLAAVGWLACALPARRAARVPPAECLSEE